MDSSLASSARTRTFCLFKVNFDIALPPTPKPVRRSLHLAARSLCEFATKPTGPGTLSASAAVRVGTAGQMAAQSGGTEFRCTPSVMCVPELVLVLLSLLKEQQLGLSLPVPAPLPAVCSCVFLITYLLTYLRS
jgi:hypothetical protein